MVVEELFESSIRPQLILSPGLNRSHATVSVLIPSLLTVLVLIKSTTE